MNRDAFRFHRDRGVQTSTSVRTTIKSGGVIFDPLISQEQTKGELSFPRNTRDRSVGRDIDVGTAPPTGRQRWPVHLPRLPPAVAVIAVDDRIRRRAALPGASSKLTVSGSRSGSTPRRASSCRSLPLSFDTPSDSSPAASPESAAVDTSSELRDSSPASVGSGSWRRYFTLLACPSRHRRSTRLGRWSAVDPRSTPCSGRSRRCGVRSGVGGTTADRLVHRPCGRGLTVCRTRV